MITANKSVNKMIKGLEYQAKKHGKSLSGMTKKNFNYFLDDLFEDGGEIRCIDFIDHADPYALQFGDFESDQYEEKRWEVIERALEYFENQ